MDGVAVGVCCTLPDLEEVDEAAFQKNEKSGLQDP